MTDPLSLSTNGRRPRPGGLPYFYSSRMPHGDPYSVSRLRKGTAAKASGPRTPVPDHAPDASSSSATTGLMAVCQATAWWPYSRIDHSLSTTWYRYTWRGFPDGSSPRTHVPAQVFPSIRGPRPVGSSRPADNTATGHTD